tara:strand:- start:193 stop:429 length:237 start_codon:yes stop_codon:yes gene_type:complete
MNKSEAREVAKTLQHGASLETMYHPDILSSYGYARVYAQRRAVDACTDVAAYYGIPVAALAQFLASMAIDAAALTLIA